MRAVTREHNSASFPTSGRCCVGMNHLREPIWAYHRDSPLLSSLLGSKLLSVTKPNLDPLSDCLELSIRVLRPSSLQSDLPDFLPVSVVLTSPERPIRNLSLLYWFCSHVNLLPFVFFSFSQPFYLSQGEAVTQTSAGHGCFRGQEEGFPQSAHRSASSTLWSRVLVSVMQ
jgi:hypothetical protein